MKKFYIDEQKKIERDEIRAMREACKGILGAFIIAGLGWLAVYLAFAY